MRQLIWRIRYAIYGQRKCNLGWKIWWHFSAGDLSVNSDMCYGPEEAAQECIYQLTSDAL